ncbi:hypothetical protein C8F04DRAFT_475643 [Mycena alexandri]|uniref:Uncharacterized protein n=1 Tax=Mycena alexandri TaxID=1745969 RepID=A0AAD6RYB4_9AGAR|nr:hypothetical protein C8F04DRAFT_475643 [Mycena alexandri]
MVIETRSDDEYTSSSGPYEPVFTSSGGMFTGSQHFTVVGGTFNNSTKNYVMTQAIPPGPHFAVSPANVHSFADFRMIPMGDIDLQNELTVNKKSGVVERRCERNCARRVYSATINGRNSNVTVAVYQGDGAEEDWGRDAEMYMSARHPNIIQIYGAASYGNIHATVFHGRVLFNSTCTP